MNDILNFNNKIYYLDVDAIMKWCLVSSNNPLKEIEINEGYDTNDNGDIQMMTKVVRELKTANSQDDTIRYDFVKFILMPFLGSITTIEEIKGNFSKTVLFNTLIDMGFLKEK
jgi:hypothetical protein